MTKKKKRKKYYFIVGALILVVAIAIGIKSKSGDKAIIVETKNAERTDVISIVTGSGKVTPKTKVNITAEVNAEIIDIPVRDGDQVNKGQILARLNTVQLQKDEESAIYSTRELEARLTGARILLEQYREDFERIKSLHEKKMASDQNYKDAQYRYRNQETQIAAMVQQFNVAKSQREKAGDNLSKATITAPMDGVITLIDAEVGEIAQAQTAFTQGKTLMILADLSTFEIDAEIDETDVARLEIGQHASVSLDAFPDQTFAGEVTEIGNTAVGSSFSTGEQSTNFKVKVLLKEVPPRVKPGMSATVDVTTDERFAVIAVPIQALVMKTKEDLGLDTTAKTPTARTSTEKTSSENGDVANATAETDTEAASPDMQQAQAQKLKGVFVKRGDTARFIEVVTGISDHRNMEIVEGLSEKDVVIIGTFTALRKLKDGDTVKVEEPKPERKKEA